MEVLHLLICVLGAPLISSLALYLTMRRANEPIPATLKRIFSLTPELGLAHQPPLWFGLATPALYFIILGIYAWYPLSLNISSEGFKNFIAVSTLPIAILSLVIPIAVLISRLHATQQTANQIISNRQKNNHDSFYSHRKNLIEYFDRIGEVKYTSNFTAKFKSHPRLHLNAFRGATPDQGTPQIYKPFFEEVESKLLTIRSFTYQQLSITEASKKLGFLKPPCCAVWDLGRMLLLPEIHNELYDRSLVVKEKKDELTDKAFMIMVGEDTEDIVIAYRYALGFYRNLCEYSGYQSEFLSRIDEDESDFNMMEHGLRFKKQEELSVKMMFRELFLNIVTIKT